MNLHSRVENQPPGLDDYEYCVTFLLRMVWPARHRDEWNLYANVLIVIIWSDFSNSGSTFGAPVRKSMDTQDHPAGMLFHLKRSLSTDKAS